MLYKSHSKTQNEIIWYIPGSDPNFGIGEGIPKLIGRQPVFTTTDNLYDLQALSYRPIVTKVPKDMVKDILVDINKLPPDAKKLLGPRVPKYLDSARADNLGNP